MKIGIIGMGFVGKAVAASYEPEQILVNDPIYPASVSVEELKERCNAIYIAVPTPQAESGKCDTSILESVVESLKGYTGVVISKCTASPRLYQHIEATSGLKFAHVPEFLTQVNAVRDYLNPHKIVIGCQPEILGDVIKVVITDKINFTDAVEHCSIGEASMFKYLANTMLAIKVIMNNEYYDLCQVMGLDYRCISLMAQTDPRLGNTHWAVPGPDGSRGFGGACFPKDTAALEYLANELNVSMDVLSEAIIKNKFYRNQ